MTARKLLILGTSGQFPTRARNHNAYLLRWDDEGLLFDPGEGTQRQMTYFGVAASEITRIFISHFHGDHCLGLPGVIQRASKDGVDHPIDIYFPASGLPFVEHLRAASVYTDRTRITLHPVAEDGVICIGKGFDVEALRLDHSVDCLGFALREHDGATLLPDKLAAAGVKGPAVGELSRAGSVTVDGREVRLSDVSTPRRGQSFAYVLDTRLCPNALKLARDADVLLCEANFLASESAEAAAYGHLTAAQAATLARDAGAGKLVLTHFSRRYENVEGHLAEARAVQPDVVLAEDGMVIDFPKRRG